jgi:hypothetical protein
VVVRAGDGCQPQLSRQPWGISFSVLALIVLFAFPLPWGCKEKRRKQTSPVNNGRSFACASSGWHV